MPTLCAKAIRGQAADDAMALARFQPAAVTVPQTAGYMLPDGSLRIVGLGDMEGMMTQLDALYAQTHAGTRFTYVKSDSLAAVYSLIFDATAVAPAGIVYPSNLTYTDIVHGPPFAVRVAHGSLKPGAEVSPLGIIVNRSNPMATITMAQVGSIFTQPARARMISHWGQAGLKGTMAKEEIHPVGLPWTDHYPSEDLNFGDFFFYRKLGNAPPVETYHLVKTYDEVVAAVSADPQAIGVVALNHVTDAVKVLGITDSDLKAPMTGTAAEIRSGQYPLDRDLYLYVRVVAGKPMEPLVKEYLRMVLSREGQAIVGKDVRGYIPLNATEVQEDLASFQ
jgi:phosphate transport system substrate-binding protein